MSYFTDNAFLVTGGAGFLGSYIVDGLRERGAKRVYVPRRADYDLRDTDAIRALLTDTRPSVVLHLAAYVGGIGANQQHPAEFFYDNAVMGIHLLEEARQMRVRKFITVGTVCAYPKHAPVPFVEGGLWDGYPEETNAPYGVAKKALLVQSQAYRQQHGMNAIYLLPTNLYGPGDNFDPGTSHVIPALIKRFVEAVETGAQSVTLWGTGNASREFLHVADCANAILLATERYDKPDPVNIGTGQEYRIRDLAVTIAMLCDYHGRIEWDASKPDGQPRRMLDTSRAREEFGFVARRGLVEGLRETISRYRDNR